MTADSSVLYVGQVVYCAFVRPLNPNDKSTTPDVDVEQFTVEHIVPDGMWLRRPNHSAEWFNSTECQLLVPIRKDALLQLMEREFKRVAKAEQRHQRLRAGLYAVTRAWVAEPIVTNGIVEDRIHQDHSSTPGDST